MALNYSALVNAVDRLGEGLLRYRLDTADTQIRDGLIKRFEFTYDVSHKMLRRALVDAAANPAEIDRMSFPTLIRTGVEQSLNAREWAIWRMFREMRNITSHTCTLPWKVDVVDRQAVSEAFGKIVDAAPKIMLRNSPG